MASPRPARPKSRARKTVPVPVAVPASRARRRPVAAPAPKPPRPRKAPAPATRVSTHPPKERTPAIEAVIDQVRAICLALPESTEVVAWGEPTWRVAGKQFAMFDTHHHGSPHLSVWIPAAPGAQAGLIEADPARFWRPPYVGGKGWVAIVVDDAAPPWDMIGALIADAHQLVAPIRKPRARR